MKANLSISMDNAAFGDNPQWELGRIMKELAKTVQHGLGYAVAVDGEGGREKVEFKSYKIPVRDLNGNPVGELEIIED